MKIAVIGAKGNLGSRVVRQALERGIKIKGFVRSGTIDDKRVEVINKSLFDIEKEDLADCDVMVSAYGSGFDADPTLNYKAFLKYIKLNEGTKRHLIAIGGAGSLFTDSTHTTYCYETPEHPEFLREISRNIKLGIDELKKTDDVNWTVVCPSLFFDSEGELTKNYEIGTEEQVIFNKDGESRVTYEDLAMAMLDIAEADSYNQKLITVLTK